MIRNSITSKKIVACDGGGVKSKNCHEARFTMLSASSADVLSDLRDLTLNQAPRVVLPRWTLICPSLSPCAPRPLSSRDRVGRFPLERFDLAFRAAENADP